jgi:hypothetical protein
MIEQAERAGTANVFPVGAITKSSDGHELAEMGEMKRRARWLFPTTDVRCRRRE